MTAARIRPLAGPRRGSALVLVLIVTVALSVLALSALYMSANATLLTKSYDREQDFKYAAEAGLALGKSRLNNDAYALPDSGFAVLERDMPVRGADLRPVPGLFVSVYYGPSGSTTGQFGTFASVVAEARDVRGARFVRRLELTQESFAKFAYWSNRETQSNGTAIYFGSGDQLWGPVWSNDQIKISATGGATFHDDVGTAASSIDGVAHGTFRKGYKLRQDRIELPTPTNLAKLPGYASSGGLSIAPQVGNNATATQVRTRIEFVALDLSAPADGDSTDADEGFVRVYTAIAGKESWVRGDLTDENCGDWHRSGGKWKFFPRAVHGVSNYYNLYDQTSSKNNTTHRTASMSTLLGTPLESGAPPGRCFLGGDPHLAPVERNFTNWASANGIPAAYASRRYVGGEDTTFTRVGKNGSWTTWGGTPYAPLMALGTATGTARWRSEDFLRTLHPLWRGANPGTKGVIHASGTVAVSGVLRGRVTLYSTGTIVLVDDLRYATDPGAAGSRVACPDVLGVLSTKNVTVADNALNTPPNNRNADDSKDLYVHAVIMATGTSFDVEEYDTGPTNANDCEGTNNGRGCLYMTGGLIQDRRGAVGTSNGTGFVKRYSYDRCAAIRPPPYFPTTGRFLDNRYSELDPVGFDAATLFARLTPNG